MSENTIINAILSRRSVRQFTNAPVSHDAIETILRAAMAAPSGMNLQPWEFAVIDDRTMLDEIADKMPYAKMCRQAQAAIAVCADMNRAQPPHSNLWMQDCAAVTQNILLAAEAVGLGAVWTCIYGIPSNISLLRDILCIPDNIEPFSLIPIGHPAGDTMPKDKYKAERIHWGKF